MISATASSATAEAKIQYWTQLAIDSQAPGLAVAAEILGHRATNVLDVGAREAGVESRWWLINPLAGQFGFEADPVECARLNAGQTAKTFFPLALSSKPESATLHITAEPACSSLYEPDPALTARLPGMFGARKVRELAVRTSTLDDWWKDHGSPDVGFIKLDTQGSELDIMRGGTNVLDGCIGCEIEVEFSAMYLKQPLFHEVDVFMRARGFELWRLYGLTHYPEDPKAAHSRTDSIWFAPGLHSSFRAGSGQLYWGNAIYFRVPESLFYDAAPQKLLVLLALMEACRDYDGVARTLRRLVAQGTLPPLPPQLRNLLLTPKAASAPIDVIETLEARLKSAMNKADKWDRFRGSLLGRLVGRRW